MTHNVSVMVIQAGAARKVMDADARPGPRGAARGRGRRPGRDGRAAPRHGPAHHGQRRRRTRPHDRLTPQPGLDQLDALVQRVRDAGMPVELTVAGEPRPLPPGVELTAYRVVQEALTNTVKHAAGATATVTRRLRRRPAPGRGHRHRRHARRRRRGHRQRPRADRPARAAGRLRRHAARRAAPSAAATGSPRHGSRWRRRDRRRCASSSPTTRRWSAPASG